MYDRVRHCNCAVSNLVVGNEYHFRIKVSKSDFGDIAIVGDKFLLIDDKLIGLQRIQRV